jgi:hypothetical protein
MSPFPGGVEGFISSLVLLVRGVLHRCCDSLDAQLLLHVSWDGGEGSEYRLVKCILFVVLFGPMIVGRIGRSGSGNGRACA